MSFDAFLLGVWPYLCRGATVHFAPAELRLEPRELGDWFKACEITRSLLPIPLAEAYLRHGTNFEQLRCLLTGADRLRPWNGHPLRRFVHHYGRPRPLWRRPATTYRQMPPGPLLIGRAIALAKTLVVEDDRPVATPASCW